MSSGRRAVWHWVGDGGSLGEARGSVGERSALGDGGRDRRSHIEAHAVFLLAQLEEQPEGVLHDEIDPAAHRRADAHDAGAAMIPVPKGVRVFIAAGATDMRRGINGLAL